MNHAAPLAERMRPVTLDDLAGQEHLTGKGSILRTAIEQGRIPSMLLWGPPGVGKTTIANIIAHTLHAPYFQLSAISSGVKDVREVIDTAKHQPGAILFIDEIHRFNKGQQDALLGAVEKGTITLIGATTENPSFEVNSALLSRCQVYVLKSLQDEDLIALLQQAIEKDEVLKQYIITLKETEALINISGGDARKLLNLFDLVVQTEAQKKNAQKNIVITNALVMNVAQKKVALYDKQGEQHYDIISAFIKSMRGSDPNGAVYWLARMIEGGEDVKFIARRMLIFASEDIGNANANALLLANATFDAVAKIGYPESRIILSQCATYLASSVKSNASYMAIGAALSAVQQHGDLPVPLHIRNAPTKLMKDLNYGKNYQYSHQGEGNFIEQEYLPEKLAGTRFYDPGNNAREQELRKFLKERWKNKYGY
ncbi:replication-associated recombination protein A [Sediminibacterium ginsengisoli]|uniref:Replication-associated recombination protein A n=1 Tax=Sediminibacterium ginsengisoli TaxID=413434 RepID=A0A1T4PZE6_9BACT|nr:replication-associated recombination protein A [Sediminibacterium ginsengisoli]SJZ96641.1 putative ATPase [Sediminibacterium ginsengisoli]